MLEFEIKPIDNIPTTLNIRSFSFYLFPLYPVYTIYLVKFIMIT